MAISTNSIRLRVLLKMAAVVLALNLTYTTTPASEIYKTVDRNGRISYSDQPSPNAQRVTIRAVPRGAAAERERIEKEMQSYAQANAQRAEAENAERQIQAKKQESEERRRQACNQARDRHLYFKEARRPYRRDEQGGRVYYSSAEIDAGRAAAEKDMNRLCATQ